GRLDRRPPVFREWRRSPSRWIGPEKLFGLEGDASCASVDVPCCPKPVFHPPRTVPAAGWAPVGSARRLRQAIIGDDGGQREGLSHLDGPPGLAFQPDDRRLVVALVAALAEAGIVHHHHAV